MGSNNNQVIFSATGSYFAPCSLLSEVLSLCGGRNAFNDDLFSYQGGSQLVRHKSFGMYHHAANITRKQVK